MTIQDVLNQSDDTAALVAQIIELNAQMDALGAGVDTLQAVATSTKRSLAALRAATRQIDSHDPTYPAELREALQRFRKRYASALALIKAVERLRA